MPEAIPVTPSVRVPAEAIVVKAVRSGGPGGQNVNKVSSKIEMRIDVKAIQGLSPLAMERLLYLVRNRMDAAGWWILTSTKTRDQAKNLEDARAKAVEAIGKALEIPNIRQATSPTWGSRARRVEDKRRVSEKKRGRNGQYD